MKSLLLLLIALNVNSAFAQDQPVALSSVDSTKLIHDYLTGFWQEDSTTNKIKFEPVGADLRLLTPGAYAYELWNTKSFPIDGVSMTWPPHGCQVKQINKNYIEVTYSPFGGPSTQVNYKKIIPE